MKTLFIGQNTIQLESVTSTNSYAQNLLVKESSVPEGTVVNAYNQTQGRGQRGNTWLSNPDEAITFSIVLYPKFLQIEDQFLLSMAVSLALADYFNSVFKGQVLNPIPITAVKWPNDIMVKNRKISGILIENNTRGKDWVSAIVGIGLNINQTSFPSTIVKPTSLYLETRIKWDLTSVLKDVLSFLEARYLQIKSGKRQALIDDYMNQLFQNNFWCYYILKGEKITARITGISNIGKLILETKDGQIIECDNKEVIYDIG